MIIYASGPSFFGVRAGTTSQPSSPRACLSRLLFCSSTRGIGGGVITAATATSVRPVQGSFARANNFVTKASGCRTAAPRSG